MLKTCFAISSECENGEHVLFGDIDTPKNINSISHLRLQLKQLQKDYDIPDIYILESTHGYNFFSLGKFVLADIRVILNEIEGIDPDFIRFGSGRGYFTLRIDNDKHFKVIVENYFLKCRKCSLAHKLFFQSMFNLDIYLPYWINDGCTKFKLVEYPSEKNGYYENVSEGLPDSYEDYEEFDYTRR